MSSSSPQIASSTCNVATSTIATTTDIYTLPTFTAGEIFTDFLLFVIIVLMLTTLVFKALDRVKIRRTYLNYSGGDVEIRDDI